jgi:hypothetical protein
MSEPDNCGNTICGWPSVAFGFRFALWMRVPGGIFFPSMDKGTRRRRRFVLAF